MMTFEEYTWRNHIGDPKPLDPNIDPITGKRIRENDYQINPTNLKSNDRLLTDEERRILWEQQLEGTRRSEEQRERERERERQEYATEEKPKRYPPRYSLVYAEFLIDYPIDVAHAKIAEWLKEQEEKERELNGEVQETKPEQKEELPVELPVDSSEAEVVFLPVDQEVVVVLPGDSDDVQKEGLPPVVFLSELDVIQPSDPDVAVKIGNLCRDASIDVLAGISRGALKYVEAGRCLLAQRNSLKYGQWLPWIEENQEALGRKVTPRMAQRLIALAKEYDASAVLDEATASQIIRRVFGNEKCDVNVAFEGRRQRRLKAAAPPSKTEMDLSVFPPDIQELMGAIINKHKKQLQEKDRQIEELKKMLNGRGMV